MLIRQAKVADAAGIARVNVDAWRVTYKDTVPEEFLTNMSYQESEQRWIKHVSEADSSQDRFIYVAEDEAGQIVGYISGGLNRDDDPVYKSELYAIYILQEYQGQGLGRRLTLTLVKRLVQAGFQSMILWVLAVNPARHFYEALGGQKVKEGQFEISGAVIDEVAYGWLNICTLLTEAS